MLDAANLTKGGGMSKNFTAIITAALCMLLLLTACSSRSSTATSVSAASSTMPPACARVLDALGPYATAQFSPDKTKLWAVDVEGAVGPQVASLSAQKANSLTDLPPLEQTLLGHEESLYDDTSVLVTDELGTLASQANNVPNDITAVKSEIQAIYVACDQKMP